jgi:F-type H+-transporting ATPase subunit gamma
MQVQLHHRYLIVVTILNKAISSSIVSSIKSLSFNSYLFFRSVVSHQTTRLAIPMLREVQEKAKLSSYDSLDDDVLQSYVEYALATHIYYALKECATSEQSSRMTAMDGASKNAG